MLLRVKVRSDARRSTLVCGDDGVWLAQLKALPADGKANEELVELAARHFGCRKADVTMKSGAGARMKVLVVPD